MYKAADMHLWQGRIDDQEQHPAPRWHQVIEPRPCCSAEPPPKGDNRALIGFACDAGILRNRGRTGAAHGPDAIRSALAGLAWHHQGALYDCGDVLCTSERQMESAQNQFADCLSNALTDHGKVIALGGGHEIAWSSYQGLARYLDDKDKRIGIINFDSHLDLRSPYPEANSGTPFRQIAEWCLEKQSPFHYLAVGINQGANTEALFKFAEQHKVNIIYDHQCSLTALDLLEAQLDAFISGIDTLYLSICLDVFNGAAAPGVSAPAALGVEPLYVIKAIELIKQLCAQHNVEQPLADIAELNPKYDLDKRTAKLAARLVYELI